MRSIGRHIALLIVALLGVAGCSETLVDPFDNDARYFTVWGYLDGGALDHTVRVLPVTRLPAAIADTTGSQSTIDAEVYSIDVESGQEVRWTHSFEPLSDGTHAHLFKASFGVRAGAVYRLEVRRSDGITASAETRVPIVDSPSTLSRADPVVGTDGQITQQVTLHGITTTWRLDTIYLMTNGGLFSRSVYLDQGPIGSSGPDGRDFTLNLTGDQPDIRPFLADLYTGEFDPVLGIAEMGFRVQVLDDQWVLPEQGFDPELLAQPDALSNVENGHGFWGSYNQFFAMWPVDTELSQALGWPR